MSKLKCFTAYDVRGQLGQTLDAEIVYRIGRAYGEHLKPKRVVVGGDIRETSEELKQALARGLMDAGADVLDIGLVGTEEIYFATQYLEYDGGIEVTASHNPKDYNGLKFVREGSRPISGDSGLFEIKDMAEAEPWKKQGFVPASPGEYQRGSLLVEYVQHLLGYIDQTKITPHKIVVNAGNGVAGHVVDQIEKIFAEQQVPVEFIKVHHLPDGSFPHGIPNPLLPECREATAQAVRDHNADFGLAWDGDFDRCFFFDERGEFVDGYYVVGLLAEAFLQKDPNAKIIYDPRLTWSTEEIIAQYGGQAIKCKTGHAFIKERMRQEDAVYGGEMSAHHYFRDFAYCDSGMIPWLLVLELLSVKGSSLSSEVAERIAAFPSSGEINSSLADPKGAIARVVEHYQHLACEEEYVDGIGFSFRETSGARWRFNLRSSNTEPVVRLNVESAGDRSLLTEKTTEILNLLRN